MSDDYLTMHRIMGREWRKYQTENVWGKGYTGHMEIALKRTYEQAFMAGFYLKFTKEDEK